MKEIKQLLVAHIPGLTRYATALVGNTNIAEDLVYDCVERALAKNQMWDQSKNFKPWLHAIMHNIFNDHYRSDNNFPITDLNIEDLTPFTNANQLDHVSINDLIKALAKLPPEQKEVLLMVTLEGMDYKHISEITNVPLGTVMSRLHRARKQLRIIMYATNSEKTITSE